MTYKLANAEPRMFKGFAVISVNMPTEDYFRFLLFIKEKSEMPATPHILTGKIYTH
jgi:hypothetical protein